MTYQRWYSVYLVAILTSIVCLLFLAQGLGPQIDKGQAIQEQINRIETQYATLQVWMRHHDEREAEQDKERADWMAHADLILQRMLLDQRTAMTPEERARLQVENRLGVLEEKLHIKPRTSP